jgi:maleate cis-trans isomerase
MEFGLFTVTGLHADLQTEPQYFTFHASRAGMKSVADDELVRMAAASAVTAEQLADLPDVVAPDVSSRSCPRPRIITRKRSASCPRS